MLKSLKEAVSASRRKLQNQYAHIEYLEEANGEINHDPISVTVGSQISESRLRLENPYAYLSGLGEYEAVLSNSGKDSPQAFRHEDFSARNVESRKADSSAEIIYSHGDIEQRARSLLTRIWRDRELLWDQQVPSDPVDLLNPLAALKIVGYEYQFDDALGQHRSRDGLIEVAGLIDRASKTVRVSRQFPLSVQMFTAAHELGHAVLHPHGGGIHRDRPIDGTEVSRDRAEREADKFASCFLMPEKLVRVRFSNLFRTEIFELNEDTAFGLGRQFPEIRAKIHSLRDLSRLLVSTERYSGRGFVPLAAQFRVSVEAMAIRIEELGLFVI